MCSRVMHLVALVCVQFVRIYMYMYVVKKLAVSDLSA